ncbi:MAG: LysM peptidoglycan-binding domain-containing protein [Kiritimatiellia bacterium]
MNARVQKTPDPDIKDKYWCFISYRHSDNKAPGRSWATWLHHLIETYEVPRELAGRTNGRGDVIPERIFPVFRDEEELPADADLASPIYRALDRSKCLVVLCSPQAAASTYVANEITYFKKIGRAERAMAAIISGEPNAAWDKNKQAAGFAPEAECFPLPLRHPVDANGVIDRSAHAEPIAPDFRLPDSTEGWTSPEAYRLALVSSGKVSKAEIEKRVEEYQAKIKLATLKVIAGILGVSLGELTKRDAAYQLVKARQRMRVLRRWLTVVGFLGLLAAAGGLYAWAKRAEAIRQRQIAVKSELETQEALRKSRKSLSQVDLERALSKAAPGTAAEDLAHLDRAIRYDPENTTAIYNIYGLLLNRDWPLPVWRAQQTTNTIFNAVFIPGRPEVAIWDESGAVHYVKAKNGAISGPPLQLGPDVQPALFSSSGSRFTALNKDGTLMLVENGTGSVLKRVQLSPNARNFFRSDDSRLIAIEDSGRLHIFGAETLDSMLDVRLGEKEEIESIVFDPSGVRMLVLFGKKVEVWDFGQAPVQRKVLVTGSFFNSAAISPDGRWIVISGGDPCAFDALSLEKVNRFRDLPMAAILKFSPDGMFLLALGTDGVLMTRYNTERDLRGPDIKQQGRIGGFFFSPDGQFLVTTSFDQVNVWDSLRGFKLLNEPIRMNKSYRAECSADGNFLLIAAPDSVVLWDIRRGAMLRKNTSQSFEKFNAISICPVPERGVIMVQTADNKSLMLDARSQKPIGKPIPHHGFRTYLLLKSIKSTGYLPPIWSPDGSWVLSDLSEQVATVDVRTGAQLRAPVEHKSYYFLPQISPDGSCFLTQQDAKTLLLSRARVKTGTPPIALNCGDGIVTSCAFSPDGQTVYAASTAGLKLFDAVTGRQKGDLGFHLKWITEVRPLAGLPLVIVALNNTLRLLDRDSGRETGSSFHHADNIEQIIQSPDGGYLYTASKDRTVRIWDLRIRQPVGAPLVIDSPLVHLSLTRDGRLLLALTESDRLYIWDAHTGHQAQSPFEVSRGSHFIHLDMESGFLTLAHQDQLSSWDLGYLGNRKTAPYETLRPLVLALAQKYLDDENHLLPVENALDDLLRFRLESPGQGSLPAWFMGDRGTRAISPYDATPVKQWISEQLNSGITDGLFECRLLDHGDPQIISKMAVELVAQSESMAYMRLPLEREIARHAAKFIIGYLAKRFPDDAEVMRRKQALDMRFRRYMDQDASLGTPRPAMATPPPREAAPASAPEATTTEPHVIHVVTTGDSLALLAKLYLVNANELAKFNGISTNVLLTPGQKLKIPLSD